MDMHDLFDMLHGGGRGGGGPQRKRKGRLVCRTLSLLYLRV
jgi:hypothetical protein